MQKNPLIDLSFIEYLEQYGYAGSWSEDGQSWTALAQDKYISIKNDTIVFCTFCEGEDDRAPEFSEYARVKGIGQLNFYKFVQLLDCFDIVPMKKLIRDARKEGLFHDVAEILYPEYIH